MGSWVPWLGPEREGAGAAGACERYVHQDRLGSVVAVTDSAGNVVEDYRYSPYGESGREGDGGFPFRFTGQKLDPETGLYLYKARYYDPEVGRFLQTDPIGYEDQMNLYAYVGNDPINNIDPDGRIAGKAIKFLRNTHKAGGNPIKGAAETIAGAAEDIGTLLDGQLNGDDLTAAVSLVTGLDKKDQAAIKGAANGLRSGKNFTRKGKQEIDQRNVDRHGKPTCEKCGQDVVPGQKSERGVTPPGNERQRDHVIPKSKGGDGTPENGQVLCRDCNLEKSDKLPE